MFEKKEQMIREQRTVEAMKNGFMGAEGKLVRIAKLYGTPIIRHDTANYQQRFLDDPYKIDNPDEIPTMSDEEMSFDIGRMYSDLANRNHLEIIWKSEFQEIRCYFNGTLVYLELGGTLDGYVPGEWEKRINVLFDQVRKKERILIKEKKEETNIISARQRKEFIEQMKVKWGL